MTEPNRPIMLVDDDESDIFLEVAALKSGGIDRARLIARDGMEALHILQSITAAAHHLPALILVDNKMPRMSGLEFLEQVKADRRLQPIPVVMLSSSRAETDLVRAYALGVNAYVVKPSDFAAFSEIVEKIGVFWTKCNEPPPAGS